MKLWSLTSIPYLTKSFHDLGREMTKKFLWVLILVLFGFQSGCALEKYHQISVDNTGAKYSHDDYLSGLQFGPSPG
jgi:hypothetical protein